MLIVARLVASLGVVILAARQRMWWCMLVGVALLVVEPWAVVAAVRSDGPWVQDLLGAYLAMGGLAVLGWVAGVRFRARRGDSVLRREVSELPLLHPSLVLLELFLALPIALAS